MEKEKSAANSPQEPTLEAVLKSFDAYVEEVTRSIIQASPEGEAKILAESTSASLLSQMKKVNVFVLETHDKLSPFQKQEFQTFLQVQDGLALAQQGVETCKKMFKKGGFGKRLLKWLSQWLGEINNIVEAIIQFLCDIFNWNYPTWLDSLLVLIDEILNLLLSIFGDSLGLDARSLEKDLSLMEVNRLGELKGLRELKQAGRSRSSSDDES